MSSQKPSLQKFQEQIEAAFGQPLTSTASLAAEDFWRNWSAFLERISNDSITLNPDMLFLSRNFPEYGRYHIWKGLTITSLLIGAVLLFFYWPVGVILLLLSVGCYFFSKYKKVADGKRFIKGLRKELIQNPLSKGMAKLCAHYIAGTIQLESTDGRAHWPQYPSNVITGKIEFIPKR
jgi:hypothetical protein